MGYGLAYFNVGKTKQNQQRLFFTIYVASFENCLSHVDHKKTIIAELNKTLVFQVFYFTHSRVRNSLFGFFVRIARFLRAKVRFALFKVRIALVALFVKSDGANRSRCS